MAVTVLYTIIVEIIAQGFGSSSVWRANVAHRLDYRVPSQVRPRDPVGLEDPNEVEDAIAASQVAIGTVSYFLLLGGIFCFCSASVLLGAECRRHGNCAWYRSWGRHSVMTVLLWLLSVGIVCEMYFYYVPATPTGGPFGLGPVMMAMSGFHDHLFLAVRLVTGALSGRPMRILDIASVDTARVAALGQPWASTVVMSLAVVSSLIVGSTTAARPRREFRLKAARAWWIVAGAVVGGFMFTLTAGALGLAQIGSSHSVQSRGLDALQGLMEALEGAGGAATNGSAVGAVVGQRSGNESLLTDVLGADGQPLLFLPLLQLSSNFGEEGRVREMGLSWGPERVRDGARALAAAGRVGSEAEGVEMLAPQLNQVSTSRENSFCLVLSAQTETSAALVLARKLTATPPEERAALLPLRLEAASFSRGDLTSREGDEAALLPQYAYTGGLFVALAAVCTAATAVFAVLLVVTPSRGLDEATQEAAEELREWAGTLRGQEKEGSGCRMRTMDLEAACAGGCVRWCCLGRLPGCCAPVVEPARRKLSSSNRRRQTRRGRALLPAVPAAGASAPRQGPAPRAEGRSRAGPASSGGAQTVSTARTGRVPLEELRGTACLHENAVVFRHTVSCCGEDAETAQLRRQGAGRGGGRRTVAAVSRLVRASIERARRLAALLKVLSIVILVELLAGPLALSLLRSESLDGCVCAQARIEGLQDVWAGCPADMAAMPLARLMGSVARESLFRNMAGKVSVRLLIAVLRVLLAACVYVYARQTQELEVAIDVSEKQRAALQSRVRFLSHECRVPLNSVVLGLDFCQEGANTTKQALLALQPALRSLGRNIRGPGWSSASRSSSALASWANGSPSGSLGALAAGDSELRALVEACGTEEEGVRHRGRARGRGVQKEGFESSARETVTSGGGEWSDGEAARQLDRADGALEMLQEAVGLFDETLPSLDAAAEAMQTTLNDVLDLQHIEAGRLRVEKRLAPLVPSLLQETKQAFAAQAEGVGVSLLPFDGHPRSGARFECDPPRIRGAVYNYVSNALKWSRPDEVLVKRLRDRGQAAAGRAGGRRNPVVVLGATTNPPHLWKMDDWQQAWGQLGGELCSKLHRIVTVASEEEKSGAGAGSSSVGSGAVETKGGSLHTWDKSSGSGSHYNPTSGPISAGALVSRLGSGEGRPEGGSLGLSSPSMPSPGPVSMGRGGSGSRSTDSGSRGAGDSEGMSDLDLGSGAEEDAGELAALAAVVESCCQVAPDTAAVYDGLLEAAERGDGPWGGSESSGDGGSSTGPDDRASAEDGIELEMAPRRADSPPVDGAGRSSPPHPAHGGSNDVSLEGATVPVCLWVFDEGPGIQRKDWGKVFTPFETLHSGILTAEGQGSGLGLAITATVMRMHDGCVGFSSHSGVGSVFFLWTRMRVAAGQSEGGAGVGVGPNVPAIGGQKKMAELQSAETGEMASAAGGALAVEGDSAPRRGGAPSGLPFEHLDEMPAGISLTPRGSFCTEENGTGSRGASIVEAHSVFLEGGGSAVSEEAGRGTGPGLSAGSGGAMDGGGPGQVASLSSPAGGPGKRKRRVVRKRKKKTAIDSTEPEGVAGSAQGGRGQEGVGTGTAVGGPAIAPLALPRPRVILVVDDSRTNRLFLSRMVRAVDRGAVVLAAADGWEGLQVLLGRVGGGSRDGDAAAAGSEVTAVGEGGRGDAGMGPAVDLVLLDFSMPRMSGPEMARAVREHEDGRVRRVPIVGVTGNALPADQRLFRECGAQDVLCKPVRRAQVAEVLGRIDELQTKLQQQ